MSVPPPIDVHYSKGLHLPELDLWLDPHRVKRLAFVSHAHADHYARHETILCSERTHALILKRYGRPRKSRFVALSYGESYDIDANHSVRLLPAGHIFGSAQCYVTRKRDGATLLYSGDFKMRSSYSAEPIEVQPAHTVVMETTFGLPQYAFPPTEEVAADVVAFCRAGLDKGEIPVLLAYSLGKAQEILAALAGEDLPVMVHKTVDDMAQVYAQYQKDLFPDYTLMDLELAKERGAVLIAPPSVARSPEIRALGKTRTAMLSGWAAQRGAQYRYQVDAVFPLSDHADYEDLLSYVEAVRPKKVYTLHGFAEEFAQDLREKGIEVWSVDSDNQLELGLRVARTRPSL